MSIVNYSIPIVDIQHEPFLSISNAGEVIVKAKVEGAKAEIEHIKWQGNDITKLVTNYPLLDPFHQELKRIAITQSILNSKHAI